MPKPRSGERRKQILRQRRAEQQREAALMEAEDLFRQARAASEWGHDPPAADRLLRKALALDPDHTGALTLIAQIHESAGHYAEAMGYIRRLRKLTDEPSVIYNIGMLHHHMGQAENAVGAMREFVTVTKGMRGPKWQKLRDSAEALCEIV